MSQDVEESEQDPAIPSLRRFHTYEPTRGAVASVLRDRETYLKKSFLEKAEEANWRISDILTVNDLPTWPEYAEDLELFERSNKRAKGAVNDDLNKKVILWQGDITKLNIDAIVNAANSSLMGGGGVDGAIHRTAGPKLLSECRTLNGCDTGDAKITAAYLLPSKYIIHTVGPSCHTYHGGVDESSKFLLKSCYKECMERVLEHNNFNLKNQESSTKEKKEVVSDTDENHTEETDDKVVSSSSSPLGQSEPSIRSIAFPCISTGIYGYPQEAASHVALRMTREWLEEHPNELEHVIFCVFLDRDVKIYEKLLPLYFPLPGGSRYQSSGEDT